MGVVVYGDAFTTSLIVAGGTFAERGSRWRLGVAGRRYLYKAISPKLNVEVQKFNFRLRMRIIENAASGPGLNFAD